MGTPKKRIGILTGGGDCPGLNAVIRAVTKSLISRFDMEVFGVEDGFEGLVENRLRPLGYDDVSGILQVGGTILGTSNKADPFRYPVTEGGAVVYRDLSDRALANVEAAGLEAVCCLGGDGSMTLAQRLREKGLKVVGVPKTIDNDLWGTDVTFGYDSAVSVAAEAIDRIHTTAQSHHRVMIVEVMGRFAGWLALGAGLAGGADVILIPEVDFDLEAVCEKFLSRRRIGRRFSIVCVAEGAKPLGGEVVVQKETPASQGRVRLGGIGSKLTEEIELRTGLETRVTILGHLQRSGTPTAYDRILATRFGVSAAEMVARGEFGRMAALRGDNIVSIPLEDVAGRMKTVPADHPLLTAALCVGTSLGVRD
ncbi:MAG: 6-phosphofructokinase [Candidatus Aminicenantes bacterium RBG_13_62_12]|nr:MAG: 6-phosphofructokinase [Candidatus Aminicenantes bacterium RBG_13_62_12]